MFDVGFSELLLIGVVALLVLGPERLPRAARVAGLWMRRARASWYAVRSEFERELADEDLRRSIKQGVDQAKSLQHELGDAAGSVRAELGAIGKELSAPSGSVTAEPPAAAAVEASVPTPAERAP